MLPIPCQLLVAAFVLLLLDCTSQWNKPIDNELSYNLGLLNLVQLQKGIQNFLELIVGLSAWYFLK